MTPLTRVPFPRRHAGTIAWPRRERATGEEAAIELAAQIPAARMGGAIEVRPLVPR